jgi:hypothetical protein
MFLAYVVACSGERGKSMPQAQAQPPPIGSARQYLTIPQAMHHAGIKSRATFDKYVLSLHIPLKKPGIGSRRHYITWHDAELLRQLREMPARLEELRYSSDAPSQHPSDG